MSRLDALPFGVKVTLVAGTYMLAARVGLVFAIPPGNATSVWPPSGIALAALLLLGRRYWVGVFLGAIATNAMTEVSWPTAVLMAGGNTWPTRATRSGHRSTESSA